MKAARKRAVAFILLLTLITVYGLAVPATAFAGELGNINTNIESGLPEEDNSGNTGDLETPEIPEIPEISEEPSISELPETPVVPETPENGTIEGPQMPEGPVQLPSITTESALENLRAAIQLPILVEVPKDIPLANVSVEFKNDGKPVAPGGIVDPEKSMSIDVAFAIDDDVAAGIKENDTTVVDLNLAGPIKLENGGSKALVLNLDGGGTLDVGTLTISKTGVATVLYNDAFQRTENQGIMNVIAHFSLSLSYKKIPAGDGTEERIFTIFGQEYELDLQKHPAATLEKKGELDKSTGTITWTLTLTPNKDLETFEGYVLTDTLPEGVEYVEGTFRFEGAAFHGEFVYEAESSTITYRFGEQGDKEISPVTIKFETRIVDISQLTSKADFINKATLVNEELNDSSSAEAMVTYTPNWIAKSGVYDSKEHSITWTLIVNENGFAMNNAVVIDDLARTLTLQGAVTVGGVSIGTDSQSKPYYTYDNKGDANKLTIYLGDIKAKTEIKFKTMVDKSFAEYDTATISNTAILTWGGIGEGAGGAGEADSSAGVEVGKPALTKNGTYNRQNHEITWTVGVNQRNVQIDDAIVKDYFIYRTEGAKITSADEAILAALKSKFNLEKAKGNLALNQKFVAGSFTGAGSESYAVTTETITVGKETLQVDVLTVSLGTITSAKTFKFKTEVTTKTIYSTGGVKLHNEVLLYSGKTALTAASGSVDIISRNIEKTKNDKKPGYDYSNRTILWDLHVNVNLMKVTNAVVTDKLPKGWEVHPLTEGAETYFNVYESTKRSSERSLVKSTKLTADQVKELLTAETKMAEGKQQVVFTFKNPIPEGVGYVIELNTRLTDQGAQDLFSDTGNVNKNINVRNDAYMTGDEILDKAEDWEDVTIGNSIINKQGTPNKETASVTWTIDVNQNKINLAMEGADKAYIVDEIPDYLELLIQGGKIQAKAWALNVAADGKVTTGQQVSEEQMQALLSYNKDTRELRFQLPKADESYRLQFDTRLVGDNVTTIQNIARLEGMKTTPSSSSNQISIEDIMAGGSAEFAGKIVLTKYEEGNFGVKLQGAEFSLYKVEAGGSETLVSTKITDETGKAEFTRLKSGTYRIEEITPPEGYELGSVIEKTLVLDTKTPAGRILEVEFENPLKTTPEEPTPDRPNRPDRPSRPDPITPPETIVPDEDVPLGQMPGEVPGEDLEIPEEEVPLGMLPKTGGIPEEAFYGLGLLLLAAGLAVGRKRQENK